MSKLAERRQLIAENCAAAHNPQRAREQKERAHQKYLETVIAAARPELINQLEHAPQVQSLQTVFSTDFQQFLVEVLEELRPVPTQVVTGYTQKQQLVGHTGRWWWKKPVYEQVDDQPQLISVPNTEAVQVATTSSIMPRTFISLYKDPAVFAERYLDSDLQITEEKTAQLITDYITFMSSVIPLFLEIEKLQEQCQQHNKRNTTSVGVYDRTKEQQYQDYTDEINSLTTRLTEVLTELQLSVTLIDARLPAIHCAAFGHHLAVTVRPDQHGKIQYMLQFDQIKRFFSNCDELLDYLAEVTNK